MSFAYSLPAVFQPGHYTACYLLAVGTYQLLLWREGRRLGFARRPWLLMQAATLLAFVVGCKLVVLPLAEWPALWQGGAGLGVFPVRSALGGIAASSLVLLALRRWLGLGWAAFDAFERPLYLGLAVQCLGCLSAGCCWGEAAAPGSLGLCFGPGTWPYLTQQAAGRLPAGAAQALPVVPTQLYALLICLGLAAVSYATRHRRGPAGARYLLGVGAVLLVWGGLGQWRDPASQTLGAAPLVLGGVRLLVVHWAVLGAGLLHLGAAGGLWWRGAAASTAEGRGLVRPGRQLAGVAGLLALTAALAPHALTGAEFRVLQAALGAVLLAELAAAWPALGTATGHWPPRLGLPRLGLPAALGLLVLMSQAPAPSARPDSARAVEFSVGGVQGRFDQDGIEGATSAPILGCGSGSPGVRVGREHHYQALGGTVSYQFRPPEKGLIGQLGLGVWVGTDEVRTARQLPSGPLVFPDSAAVRRYALADFNPFVAGTHHFKSSANGAGFGYRLGFHVGNLLYATAEKDLKTLRPSYSILPEAMVWLGNRRTFYGQADAGYGPNSVGNYYYRFGLGSGLGSRRGGTMLAGVSLPDAGTATFLGFAAANICVPHSGFSLEPAYATDFDRTSQLSLRLHYRLGLK